MQYYLFVEGVTQGPFDGEEVREAYREGDIDEKAQVRPVSGGDWTPLPDFLADRIATPPALEGSLTVPAGEAVSIPIGRSAEEYLRELRDRSCYKILRIILGIWYVVASFGVLAVAAQFFLLYGVERLYVHAVGVIMAAFLSVIFLSGLRLVITLIIDLADARLARDAREISPRR